MPAETVSRDSRRGGGASSPVLIGGIVAVVAFVVIVAASSLTRTHADGTGPVATVAPPTAPPAAAAGPATPSSEGGTPVTADGRAAPGPPLVPAPVVAPSAPASSPVASPPPDATRTTSEPDRVEAKKLLARAKLATRDGEDEKGRLLAEKAAEVDPTCEPCWRTLAFMRGRAGDRAGAAVARARADALKAAITPKAPAPG